MHKTSSKSGLFYLVMIILAGCSSFDPMAIETTVPTALVQESPVENTFLIAPIPYDAESISLTCPNLPKNSVWRKDGEVWPADNPFEISLNPGSNEIHLEGGETTYHYTLYRSLPVYASTQGDGGVEVPEPRFEILSDLVAIDRKTGLFWMRNANYPGIIPWAEISPILNELNAASWGGFDDWRIPNIREIRSIRDFTQRNSSQWLETEGFSEVQGTYWTSHRSIDLPEHAWMSLFNNAHAPQCISMQVGNYFWAVRGESPLAQTGNLERPEINYEPWEDAVLQQGIAWPEPRFLDNGDGTLTDNMTGLIWMKDAGTSGTLTYPEAETWMNELNGGTSDLNCGYSDWRLPTVDEAETLIHYGKADMRDWLLEQGFEHIRIQYKTRTQTIASRDFHFTLMTMNGLMTHNDDVLANTVWPVRGPERN